MNNRLKRYWLYLRTGFSLYLNFPLAFVNFLLLGFYLLIDEVAWLKTIFPHFHIFFLATTITVVPLAIGLGWLHICKSGVFATETVVNAENNPLFVKLNRLGMEYTIRICEKLDIPVEKEYLEFYDYWKKLDEGGE